MLAKAADLPVDEVVVDLEDGIAVADKESARQNLGGLRARGTLAVRINGVRTRWWRDDIAAAAHVDVIVVPKVESPDVTRIISGRDFFLGAGLYFTDEDISKLIGLAVSRF